MHGARMVTPSVEGDVVGCMLSVCAGIVGRGDLWGGIAAGASELVE